MNHFVDYESSSRRIERLSEKNTFVHGMNPLVKIVITILYLCFILSFSQYELDGLIIFLAFEILVILVAEIPFKEILRKVTLTLPFIALIGISNLILNRVPIFIIGSIVITKGMISLLTILLKTGMSISAVFLLIATTETNKLMMGFRLLHIPNLFLVQFELILRYIGVLVEEARNMYYAYRLRMPGVKGIVIRHMGEFIGQLLMKSIARSERIYHAMKCRGYHGNLTTFKREKLQGKDYLQLIMISLIMILGRLIKVFL